MMTDHYLAPPFVAAALAPPPARCLMCAHRQLRRAPRCAMGSPACPAAGGGAAGGWGSRCHHRSVALPGQPAAYDPMTQTR